MNLQKVSNGFSEQLIKPNLKKVDCNSFADKLEVVKNNKSQERSVDNNTAQEKPKTENQKKTKEVPKEEVKKEEVKSEKAKVVEETVVKEELENQNDAQIMDELPVDLVASEEEEELEFQSADEQITSIEGVKEDINSEVPKINGDEKSNESKEFKVLEKNDLDSKKSEVIKSQSEVIKSQSELSVATQDKEELAIKGLENKSEIENEEILKKPEKQIDDVIENSKFVANMTSTLTEEVEGQELKEDIQEVQRPVFEDLKSKAKPKEERSFNMGSENAEINDIEVHHLGRNVQRFNHQTFEEVMNERFDSTETVKTMLEDISYQINQSKRQIKIQLKPETLGEMIVDLRMDKGSIVAKIVVENDRAKEMIEQNLFQLKEILRNSKVEIKTVEVFVGQENDFINHQGQMQERQPQQTFIRNLKPNKGYEEIAEEELVATISGRGEGLDILV